MNFSAAKFATWARHLFRHSKAESNAVLSEGSVDALRSYDRETGTWSSEAWGPFWGAVQLAHMTGRLGAGKSVAVVDGWVDIEKYPRLAERVKERTLCKSAVESVVGTDHGTVVCLLISEVAPEADIYFFGVCDSIGRPDPDAVREALSRAAEMKVDVINLSAGKPRTLNDSFHRHQGPPAPFCWEAQNFTTEDNCEWCSAVDIVAGQGIPIVAAVGNDPDKIYCPARSPHVFAVGFHVERRVLRTDADGRIFEVGEVSVPSVYPQSSLSAFTIEHVEGALGSSFSAPLLTGALALNVDRTKLPLWMSARTAGCIAVDKMNSGEKSMVADAKHDLARGFSFLPHDHFPDDEPASCFECSLFCEALYTQDVLYVLGVCHNLAVADRHAWLAQRLMPWSRHAFVNRAEIYFRRSTQATSAETRKQLIRAGIEQLRSATLCNPPSLLAEARLDALHKLQFDLATSDHL